MPAFIETQFPIARLSAESYKERKGASSQTLPKLGKWWGRKPLILVRASILGMLMPASDNPKKDREIFLKILTMDDDGVWQRNKGKIKDRNNFDSLNYADRLRDCDRPENVDGPLPIAWSEINNHLSTNANSILELIEQLGKRTFGHAPRVGDSFCGGGSIPFEAARIGCEVFGSDLSPVASLLTWVSLNLLGGGNESQEEVCRVQRAVFTAVDQQVTEWGIEHNDKGERAQAFLYCVEVKPEGCEYYIPLAPSWVISEKFRIVVRWQLKKDSDRLQAEVLEVSESQFKLYNEKMSATIENGRVIDPFDNNRSWSLEALRGPDGLRRWTNDDFVPRPNDVFQERLYCIRWGDLEGKRRYSAPDNNDLERETKVLELLKDRFVAWQTEGYIPSKSIESGYNTDQPIRERGWSFWHHLFTPRQLLINGLIAEVVSKKSTSLISKAFGLLTIARIADWNSKLCRWIPHLAASGGIGAFAQTFYNQALNTLCNWGVRSLTELENVFGFTFLTNVRYQNVRQNIISCDARDLKETCDLWITDPPYADAVNYHELGDFFLAWYDKQLAKAFPEWVPDSRAQLAVRGDGEDFSRSMVEIYRNLANHMPDNGLQLVMFTHQDPSVWADLGMILWAAGLKATAAWTISTETEAAGIKKGNYVQGTVCLVLRKRVLNEPGFLDEIYPKVEDEVRRQIDSMRALDEGGEPNFNDSDYQLAAYAAALKVLTQYGNIDGRDVEHEVFAVRSRDEKSDFQTVIERALGIACNYLMPKGLDAFWRDLTLPEQYYLRALDIESRGEHRTGMYEELARGFGITEIKPLLKSDKANGARVFTPTGFESSLLSPVGGEESSPVNLPSRRGRLGARATHPFASSALRHLIYAIRETAVANGSPETGRQYLRDTFGQSYWTYRERFVGLLEWLAQLGNTAGMEEWLADSEAARLLAGRLRNDHA